MMARKLLKTVETCLEKRNIIFDKKNSLFSYREAFSVRKVHETCYLPSNNCCYRDFNELQDEF